MVDTCEYFAGNYRIVITFKEIIKENIKHGLQNSNTVVLGIWP